MASPVRQNTHRGCLRLHSTVLRRPLLLWKHRRLEPPRAWHVRAKRGHARQKASVPTTRRARSTTVAGL